MRMMQKIKLLNKQKNPKKKILFLGYNKTQTKIIDELIKAKCQIFHTSEEFNNSNFDLIISFGYKFIIPKNFLDKIDFPAINIHISYLPYNRGSHPNFWSFYDNTPPGVSIHLIDNGIDTGPILFQKKVFFGSNEITFRQTYNRLKLEAENLFLKNLDNILNERWTPLQQGNYGSIHFKKDLPKDFLGWDSNINKEITRLNNKNYAKISNN